MELTPQAIQELKQRANATRRLTLKIIASLGTGHIGGSLSISEMITSLYFQTMKIDPERPQWSDRDRFVLSKGHAGPALYAALILRGYLPESAAETLNRPGTTLPSHCDMNLTRGVDMTTGSLGQGISAALGIALALKLKGKDAHVFTIVGDGESQEGQVWETAMYAGSHRVDNLIVLLDNNKLQSDGLVEQINAIEPIADKWKAFGFHVQRVDGHDVVQLVEALEAAKQEKGRPSLIICDTIKAKGAGDMENTTASHNGAISKERWIALDQKLAEGGKAQ